MMPSYSKSRWTAIFFVAYMSIVFYFLTNLITAVVYASFTIHEKDKIKKLLLHRREAAFMSYRILTERWPLTIEHFFELIRHLDSSKSGFHFGSKFWNCFHEEIQQVSAKRIWCSVCWTSLEVEKSVKPSSRESTTFCLWSGPSNGINRPTRKSQQFTGSSPTDSSSGPFVRLFREGI